MSLELQEVKKQVDDSFTKFHEIRGNVVDDIKFAYVDGGQSSLGTAEILHNSEPEYTINRILQPLNQINGQYRSNKITGRVMGSVTNSDTKVATILTGLMKKVESVSNADEIYAQSFNHIASGGYSAWRVENKFVDKTFDQELRIIPIRDPFYNVWGDSTSNSLDSKDWNYGAVISHMSKIDFKRQYGDAEMVDVSLVSDLYTENTRSFQWFTDATVKIADYYRVLFKDQMLFLMDNGTIFEDNEKNRLVMDELRAEGINVKNTRKFKKRIVERYRVSGAGILEGPFIWPGQWIPIVEAFGYNLFIDGEFHYRGKVKFAKDSQMLYNFATKRLVEMHDPIQATPKQMEKYENFYFRFNELRPTVLPFTPDPENPTPPSRMSTQAGGSAELQALTTLLQQADFSLKATMGEFGATLGVPEGRQSGRAINQLRQQSDSGSFDLIDSMARSIKYTWELAIDAAPKIYDTARQIATLDDEGEDDIVFINKEVTDKQTGEKVLLNDLSRGSYTVEVSIGPATATQKEQFLSLLNEARANDPILARLSADLFIKYFDAPFSAELSRRIRKQLLKEGAVDPNEEEKEQLAKEQNQTKDDPAVQLQMQLAQQQMLKLMLENEEIAGKIDKLAIDHDKTRAEVGKIIAETTTEYVKEGIPVRDQDLLMRTLQSKEMIDQLIDQGKREPQNPAISSTPQGPAPQGPDVNQQVL